MMTVETHTEGRAQYIYIKKDNKQISAARILITGDRFSPWLITHGKELLPENNIKRGIYLTKLFNKN